MLVLPCEPVSADDADVGQPVERRAGPARPARRPGRRRPRRARAGVAGDSTAAAPARPARRRRSRGRRPARPTTATNSPPRSAIRLSMKAGPSTVTPGVVHDGAADHARRSRAGVIGDHRARQLLAQHVAVVEGVHRAARPPGRSRGPCPRPPRCRRRRASETASAIASRRSPTSCTSARSAAGDAARRRRARSARIAAGSSLRGLSSVTTSTSASRAAISPIIGRLPGSRSPPAPITTTSRPVVSGRSARQRGGDGVGLVGVVDDGEEVLPGVDLLQPAGHAAERAHRGGDRGRRRSRPRRGRRWRTGRWRR